MTTEEITGTPPEPLFDSRGGGLPKALEWYQCM